MKHKLYLLLIIAPFLLQSCILAIIDDSACITGHGDIVSETFLISDFSAVKHESVFDIEILQGDEYEITIEGHENMIDEVEIWVNSRGVLNIDLAGNCYNDFDLMVYVVTPFIESVKLESTGDIYIDGFENLDNLDITNNSTGTIWSNKYLIASDELNIWNNSTGDVDLIVSAPEINVDIDGTGDVILFGECYKQNVRTDGTGDYKAFNLLSELCTVVSYGTGDAEVFASRKLYITVNSTGDVFYSGGADAVINENSVGDAIYVSL